MAGRDRRVLLLLLFHTTCVAAADIVDVFASFQGSISWPVPSSSRGNVSSTFGPRIRSSCGCYDFHRGVDIHSTVGQPVVASYNGTVVRIVNYTDGGLTVILEHAFPPSTTFGGRSTLDRWYTLYLHLEHPPVASLGDVVASGDQIARVGMTGSTSSPHLHHEVRVGTRCSLEYALQNPGSTCNTLGYDPHVHPMLVYPDLQGAGYGPSLSATANVTPTVDGIVRVSTIDTQPNLNKYQFQVLDCHGQLKKTHLLNLNLRTGFDPNTTAALDTPDTSKPYLNPISFGYTASTWAIDAVVPASWASPVVDGDRFLLVVTDVWGNSTSIEFSAGGQCAAVSSSSWRHVNFEFNLYF